MNDETSPIFEEIAPSVETSVPSDIPATSVISTPMDVEEKARRLISWLEEKQAHGVLALDLRSMPGIAEVMIIVTARGVRHGQALADFVMERASESKLAVRGMEGYQVGQWVLLDLYDVMIHVFQETTRRRYNLEGLWTKAAVLYEGSTEPVTPED